MNVCLNESTRLDLESLNLTSVPDLISETVMPTLNDGWLSGIYRCWRMFFNNY